MERIDDLQYRGLVLLQDDALPCFTEDAVLLVRFLRLRPEDRVIDIGCGTGVLSVLGAAHTGASFTGIDIQPALVSLAARSAALNGQAIAFETLDARDAPARFGHGVFSAAVCNPPYCSAGSPSPDGARAAARHDAGGTLETMLRAAFLLLKNGGRLFLCYPARELVSIACALRAHRLEPKRLRLVAQTDAHPPYLALLEAKKDAHPGVVVEPALLLHPKTEKT